MSSISENVDDRLSMLPDEILSHILSLMPTKFAVQTSILSKRWRYIWMFVTNLDFGNIRTMDSLHSLTIIVDRVLRSCTPSQIKLFRLHFPLICARVSRVSNWIDELVRLKISELDLRVHQLQLPPSMFTCRTLTKLRLESSGYDYLNVWEFKCPVKLPCLKTLDMFVFSYPSVNAFKLIGGCSMLESLTLDVRVRQEDEEDYVFNIPTLKRLKLTSFKCGSWTHKVFLHVPNLEYLCVESLCSLFVMEDVSSLVEASVSLRHMPNIHPWVELLKGLNGVKSLLVECLSSQLCIEVNPYQQKPEEYGWVEPELVPACMTTNLTTVNFSISERWKCDIAFLKYMMGNAQVLKTLTVTWKKSSMEKEKFCAEDVKLLPMASRYCEIHFHEK